MRIKISADSASTTQLRNLLAELSRIGKRQTATVGLNGPEKWTVETPHLTPQEFASVVGGLVRWKGERIIDVIENLDDQLDRVECGLCGQCYGCGCHE